MRDFIADLIEAFGMSILRLGVLVAQSAVLMVLLRLLHETVDARIPAYGLGGCMIIVSIKIVLDLSTLIYRIKAN